MAKTKGSLSQDADDNAVDSFPITTDFKQSRQLHKEQTKRLDSIHEMFAQTLASSLSNNLRMVIDIGVTCSDQLLYEDFVKSLTNPCTVYNFTIDPQGSVGLCNFSTALLDAIIDRSFGGQGRVKTSEAGRQPTQIEMSVVGKLINRVITNLEASWESTSAIRIANVALQTHPEFIQMTPLEDKVHVITFEANSKGTTGQLHLCYPVHFLDQILPRLAKNAPTKKTRKPAAGSDKLASLDKTKIPLYIQVARGRLALNDIADLQIGDVIKLETQKNDPAVVFVGDKPKFLALPGMQGEKRAVQIIKEIAEDEEDIHL